MSDTVPVTFTRDELWLMHQFVKHEQSPQWVGAWPNYSLELNGSICEAILLCEEMSQTEATLMLSKGDCLLLDHVIPQDAKSPAGTMIGRNLLVKTFRARQALAGAPQATAKEPPVPDDIDVRLEEWQKKNKRLPRKRSA